MMMTTPHQPVIENFAGDESFDTLDTLSGSYSPIKELLRAAQIGNQALLQPLYTRISSSSDPEISSLTQHPYPLLTTLLTISIGHQHILALKHLLTITPSPKPDLRRFLNQPGSAFSTKITCTANPEIRCLMLKYDYQRSDRPGVSFHQPLYDIILSNNDDYLPTISAMLENGAQVKMAHLSCAIKLNPLSVFKLLLEHYPPEGLGDCRLLHDAVKDGKAGRVKYLIDAVGIDIDMLPTERPESDTEMGGFHASRRGVPNGTPLHEAVRRGRKIILEILLGKGARRDIRDEDGLTASELAKEIGKKDFLTCFKVGAGLKDSYIAGEKSSGKQERKFGGVKSTISKFFI